jgi:hypothetical protein
MKRTKVSPNVDEIIEADEDVVVFLFDNYFFMSIQRKELPIVWDSSMIWYVTAVRPSS